MSLDVNKNIEKTNKSSAEIIAEKMAKKYNKPPLGAPSYWFSIENRIAELGRAILRYNADGITIHTDSIRKWAKEIILYCELVEQMKGITL